MRLPLAALALVSLLFSLPAGGIAAAPGLAFILNSAGASISVIDMATEKEVRRIPVLREPHHVALSPDGKSLLVGDTTGNEMLFLDPATGNIQKRVPCADPYQLGFSPDGKFLVVNGLARNQVDIYDAADFRLLTRIPLHSMPSHLAFSPDSRMVFVTLQGTDRLAAINLNGRAVAWDQPVGKTPAGVLWLNGRLLVANMGTDAIAEVDPASGHVTGHVHTGRGAHNLFLSPDGKTLWVNNRAAGTTVALDATTLKEIRSYAIPGGPDDIDFAPDGRLWITRRWAEKVAVLNPATGEYDTIDVGRSPHGLFLNAHPAPHAKVALGPAR
jgi:DNA-binding beta-propeller fold protein YncE